MPLWFRLSYISVKSQIPRKLPLHLKKALSILLLTCLLLNTGGYWLYIKVLQVQRRNEVRAQLREQSSVPGEETLVFALNGDTPVDASFEKENDHEFYYKGKLYDIIEQQVKGGKLHIRCLEDEKEESLLNKLEKVQHEQQNKKGSDHSLIQQLASLVFVQTTSFPELQQPVSGKHTYPFYTTSILPVTQEVSAPPPRA